MDSATQRAIVTEMPLPQLAEHREGASYTQKYEIVVGDGDSGADGGADGGAEGDAEGDADGSNVMHVDKKHGVVMLTQ